MPSNRNKNLPENEIETLSNNSSAASISNSLIRQDSTVNTTNTGKMIGHFSIGEKLGEGTFSKVCIGTHVLTQEKVAIKILEKIKILDPSDKMRIEKEINILKQLRHNNIIQQYCIIETNNTIYIITEYCSGGELFDYIISKKKLLESEACKIFQQLIAGVEYIHSMGVVHRDLKPENLLFDYKRDVKIADLGLSNYYPPGGLLSTPCGSPCYAAPEMVRGLKYHGAGVDIWSCGIVLYTMVCGYLPFEDDNQEKLFMKIAKGNFSIPSHVSPHCKDLMKSILNTDPSKRLNFSKIKEHTWFKMGFNITKFNIFDSPGLSLKDFIIPLDESLVLTLVEEFNFPLEDVVHDIIKNRHNSITTTYYLLLRKKIKLGDSSVANICANSDDFIDYINSSTSRISHFSGNLNNAIDEYFKKFNEKILNKKRKYLMKEIDFEKNLEKDIEHDLENEIGNELENELENGIDKENSFWEEKETQDINWIVKENSNIIDKNNKNNLENVLEKKNCHKHSNSEGCSVVKNVDINGNKLDNPNTNTNTNGNTNTNTNANTNTNTNNNNIAYGNNASVNGINNKSFNNKINYNLNSINEYSKDSSQKKKHWGNYRDIYKRGNLNNHNNSSIIVNLNVNTTELKDEKEQESNKQIKKNLIPIPITKLKFENNENNSISTINYNAENKIISKKESKRESSIKKLNKIQTKIPINNELELNTISVDTTPIKYLEAQTTPIKYIEKSERKASFTKNIINNTNMTQKEITKTKDEIASSRSQDVSNQRNIDLETALNFKCGMIKNYIQSNIRKSIKEQYNKYVRKFVPTPEARSKNQSVDLNTITRNENKSSTSPLPRENMNIEKNKIIEMNLEKKPNITMIKQEKSNRPINVINLSNNNFPKKRFLNTSMISANEDKSPFITSKQASFDEKIPHLNNLSNLKKVDEKRSTIGSNRKSSIEKNKKKTIESPFNSICTESMTKKCSKIRINNFPLNNNHSKDKKPILPLGITRNIKNSNNISRNKDKSKNCVPGNNSMYSTLISKSLKCEENKMKIFSKKNSFITAGKSNYKSISPSPNKNKVNNNLQYTKLLNPNIIKKEDLIQKNNQKLSPSPIKKIDDIFVSILTKKKLDSIANIIQIACGKNIISFKNIKNLIYQLNGIYTYNSTTSKLKTSDTSNPKTLKSNEIIFTIEITKSKDIKENNSVKLISYEGNEIIFKKFFSNLRNKLLSF